METGKGGGVISGWGPHSSIVSVFAMKVDAGVQVVVHGKDGKGLMGTYLVQTIYPM